MNSILFLTIAFYMQINPFHKACHILNFNERQRSSIMKKRLILIYLLARHFDWVHMKLIWNFQKRTSINFLIDKNRITQISVKSSPAERENFLMMVQSQLGLVRGAMVFDEPRFLLNLLSLNYKKEIQNKWKQFKVFRNLIGPSSSSNLLPISGQCQKFWLKIFKNFEI